MSVVMAGCLVQQLLFLPSFCLSYAVSAAINSSEFTFGTAEKFDVRLINASNIIGILDCKDSDGNEWYEVPNLSQENVFDTIKNTNTNDPNYSFDPEVPYLLQLKQVQRRFVTRFFMPSNEIKIK